MREKRIFEQIVNSNLDFHPAIQNSRLCIDDKIAIQRALIYMFDGDFQALIESMLEKAIAAEEYEMAVIIRDELQNK
jgi:siderophore synthetase component